jgi:hypothetical protein
MKQFCIIPMIDKLRAANSRNYSNRYISRKSGLSLPTVNNLVLGTKMLRADTLDALDAFCAAEGIEFSVLDVVVTV